MLLKHPKIRHPDTLLKGAAENVLTLKFNFLVEPMCVGLVELKTGTCWTETLPMKLTIGFGDVSRGARTIKFLLRFLDTYLTRHRKAEEYMWIEMDLLALIRHFYVYQPRKCQLADIGQNHLVHILRKSY